MNEITINSTDQIILRKLRPMSAFPGYSDIDSMVLAHNVFCNELVRAYYDVERKDIYVAELGANYPLSDFTGWIPSPIYRPNKPE